MAENMGLLRDISWLAFNVLIATGATAQELARQADGQNVYVPAEPIKTFAPKYPTAARNQRREGWVVVSFIISEKGRVIEPMIEDSSDSVFDASALHAIEQWSYKPATLGGKPVEQSVVQRVIRYRMDEAKGPRPRFIEKVRATESLIVAKNFTEANQSLQALEQGELNYHESAWLWHLKYVYLEAMGGAEPEALMEAIGKAVGGSGRDDDYLDPDTFLSVSQRLYVLRVLSGDFSGALAVREQIQSSTSARRSKRYEDVGATLEASYREILNAVAGPQVLRQSARIDGHNYWVHPMLRRSFSYGDVENGRLDLIDLRCTGANRRLVSVPEDAVLKIPDAWGDCRVYIKGDPGTTFSFEEHANNVANTIDPMEIPSKTE
jgi:TonB family protein